MSQRVFRTIMLILVVIAHIVTFLEFSLHINCLPLPIVWNNQFFFLLLLSLLIAVWLPFCKHKSMIWLLLGFHTLIFLVIDIPMVTYLDVELTLATVLIIEALEYTTLRDGIIFSIALIVVTLGVAKLPITAWGVNLKVVSLNELWPFAVYSGIIVILNSIIRFQRDSQVSTAKIKKTYQEIVLQLGQVNMQLQEYATTVEQETLLNERKRLLREIHDTVAYTLTNLTMMLEAAKYIAKDNDIELYEHLERARNQANNGLTEVHRVLQALQPFQLSKTSGLQAIQQLVTTFAKATQIAVDFSLGNAPLHFGDDAELVAYRFVQEGITNALRHGRATEIAISISLFDQKIHILIKDNGVGMDEAKEGYGLAGMRERIEGLGGQLRISSGLGLGFRLLAIIPIKGV